MKMTMKLGEILSLNHAIKNAIDTNKSLSISIKFRLLGLLKAFEGNVANYEAINNEKINEYGEKQINEESGQVEGVAIKPGTEYFKKYFDEMNALISEDVEVDITKLKVNDVMKENFTSDELLNLYNIMEDKN